MKPNIRRLTLFVMSVIVSILVLGCQKSNSPEVVAPSPEVLSTLHQKVSYIKSYRMVKKGAANGAVFDEAVMARAIYEAQNGIASKISKGDEAAIMMQLKRDYEAKILAEDIAKAAEEASENAKKGAHYLTDNAKKEGVIVTDSGLQYRVLTAVSGDLPKPSPDNGVVAHYKGSLIDGQIFKNTFTGPKPAKFLLKNMIPGWIEGLQLMKPGEKFEFVVPSYLAYGEKGNAKRLIGANATLVFEIELFDIELLENEAKK